MVSQIPQNVGFYPGCQPTMIENHTNPEAEQFRAKINDEIKFKQAYVRMEFLQNTLNKCSNELTQVQKNVLIAELTDAQRTFATIQQQLNSKYNVG